MSNNLQKHPINKDYELYNEYVHYYNNSGKLIDRVPFKGKIDFNTVPDCSYVRIVVETKNDLSFTYE